MVLPLQVLGELYRVLVGKLHRPPAQAREAVRYWSDAYLERCLCGARRDLGRAAIDLSIRDSLILSVAAERRAIHHTVVV